MSTYADLKGATVYDINHDKVGSLDDFYIDDNTEKPTWMTVKTGMFGNKVSFVPLALAHEAEDGIEVDVTKDEIKEAPHIAVDEELEVESESELYKYYQAVHGHHGNESDHEEEEESEETPPQPDSREDARDSGPGHDTSGPSTDEAMTRSEEELQVNKEKQAMGKVKLKKYIVTEQVNFTVPVKREHVRLVQEPITDVNLGKAKAGPELSEEEHEMTLNEERVTINKQVVPKERMRLKKDVTEEQRHVKDEVRKEQIDMQGDGEEKS